jgi:carbonic anhydrase
MSVSIKMRNLEFSLFLVVLAVYPRLNITGPVLEINGFTDPRADSLNMFLIENPPNYSQSGRDWTGLCQTGREQSPIGLRSFPDPSFEVVSERNSSYTPLRFTNAPIVPTVTDLNFFNLYWVYDADYVSTQVVMMDAEQVLASFTLHAPSEHTIDGIRYPLSVELMYSNVAAGGNELGGGPNMEILFIEGNRSTFLDQLVNEDPLDLSGLFPAGGVVLDYFFYMGSWNFPASCAEGISWVVPNYQVEASPDQIQYFTDLYVNNFNFTDGRGNVRGIQPINDRIVTHFVSAGESTSFLGE